MKAFTLTEVGSVSLQDAPKPEIEAPTDAVVRVVLTSICGSDVHLAHGAIPSPPPFGLGHEAVGIVESVGAGVPGFAPGDRVLSPAAPWCGSCDNCRAGQAQACQRGGVFGAGPAFGSLNGAMAQFMRIPFADRVLSRIPDALTDEQALLLGDVVPTGMSAVTRALTHPGQVLVVIGCGPVGLSAVLTAKLFGPSQIIAIDRVAGRLEVARALGASLTIDASTEDAAAAVLAATGGRGADAVVEAVGLPTTIQQTIEFAGIGAHIAIVGVPAQAIELPMPEIFFKGLTLWSGLGDLTHLDRLIELVAQGVLDPTPMITDRATLDDIGRAFERFSDPSSGVVKYAISVS